ncbi:MAG: DUF1232 domain-containing protein [Candidatus Kapabacteria bacterium]|nr:DUF1232 domain-containing protein [Candidatus Kapabacteria bacterium]
MRNSISTDVRPEDEDEILAHTEERLRSDTKLHAAATLLHNIGLLFRMLRDKRFSMQWSSRALILGGLLYFLLPMDATPDYIPFVGYIDDTLIIGWVIKRLASEIERYRLHNSY